MIVEMLACMAGDSFVRNPGDVIEVDDAEGQRLIDAGFAAEHDPELETASDSPAENAAHKRGRPRVNRTGDGA